VNIWKGRGTYFTLLIGIDYLIQINKLTKMNNKESGYNFYNAPQLYSDDEDENSIPGTLPNRSNANPVDMN
jgi:hypothetical protein